MSYRSICRWVVKSRSGQQQLKDAAHTCRPAITTAKSNIEKICNILQKDALIHSKAIKPVDKLVVSTCSWYFKKAFTI